LFWAQAQINSFGAFGLEEFDRSFKLGFVLIELGIVFLFLFLLILIRFLVLLPLLHLVKDFFDHCQRGAPFLVSGVDVRLGVHQQTDIFLSEMFLPCTQKHERGLTFTVCTIDGIPLFNEKL